MTDITDTARLEFIQSEAEGNGFNASLRHTTYGPVGSPVHNAIRTEWSVNGRTWHPTFREALDEAIKLDEAFDAGIGNVLAAGGMEIRGV